MNNKNYNIHDINIDEFINIIKNSSTWFEILKKCGYNNCGNNKTILKRCTELNIDTSHLPSGQGDNIFLKGIVPKKYTLEEILIENSPYKSMTCLKKRLIKEKGFEHKCYKCNLTEWQGKTIPIELEHINGIHSDNRIENITFLCCNCHALTDTYKGKNIKNKCTKEKVDNTCEQCKKIITSNAKYCHECYNIKNRKVSRPSYQELLGYINNNISIVQIGKIYNVCDNTIRKWIKQYEKNINN